MKNVHYFWAGRVERSIGGQPWRDGFSRVTPLGSEQPWLTKREAQTAAKREGAKAVFHLTEKLARAALLAEKP